MIEVLLSGLIGAIIGSGLTIVFTILRDKKLEQRRIAKEKLEKVYGPLIALQTKINLKNSGKDHPPLPSNPMEVEMIEKIIFHYYYLIDNDLKEDLVLLHSDLRNNPSSMIKIVNIMDKVKKHYTENKKFLRIK